MITAVVSTLVGTTILLGLFIRFGLVPYMRSQLIDPILVQFASVIQLANEATLQVHVIARAWDGHLESSDREFQRLWEAHRLTERMIRERT